MHSLGYSGRRPPDGMRVGGFLAASDRAAFPWRPHVCSRCPAPSAAGFHSQKNKPTRVSGMKTSDRIRPLRGSKPSCALPGVTGSSLGPGPHSPLWPPVFAPNSASCRDLSQTRREMPLVLAAGSGLQEGQSGCWPCFVRSGVQSEVASSNRRVFPTSRPAEVACVCASAHQLQSPAVRTASLQG